MPTLIIEGYQQLGPPPNARSDSRSDVTHDVNTVSKVSGPALPRDWTVAGIFTMQSGLPLPVTQVTNFNAFAGFGTQRPNRLGNPLLPNAERKIDRYFDTNAFHDRATIHIG